MQLTSEQLKNAVFDIMIDAGLDPLLATQNVENMSIQDMKDYLEDTASE